MSQRGCILYQRKIQSDIQSDIQGEEDELERIDQRRRHLPGLPFGAHVSADTAVVPQTQSGLAIPARDIGVSPGSIEGASRVAQIMWFGFLRIGQHKVSHWLHSVLRQDEQGALLGV